MATTDDDTIECQICGEQVHAIQVHIKNDHKDWTLDKYREEYPDAPLLSKTAQAKIAARKKSKDDDAQTAKKAAAPMTPGAATKAFHDVFELGGAAEAKNAKGKPIPVTVFNDHETFGELIPDPDPNYVFPIDVLKDAMMGYELNIPVYLWGHAGTGKTTLHKQIAARTRRAMLRVQHTVNTEESHILGQWTVRDGQTVFEPGPLALCMKHGLVYLADEYDRALPTVLSVYQPVLEGEPLVIKEADEKNRIVRPHPHFRFVATGNTNGVGDETGLYQSTQMGDASNYERFGIVKKVNYMTKSQERQIIEQQAEIPKDHAERLVEFATMVRKAYDGGAISMTVSPRALINAAKLGIRRGDYTLGVQLALTNRLGQGDREVVDQLCSRHLGA